MALWVDQPLLATTSSRAAASGGKAANALQAIMDRVRQPEYDLTKKGLPETGRILLGPQGIRHVLAMLEGRKPGSKSRLYLDKAQLEKTVGRHPELTPDFSALLTHHLSKERVRKMNPRKKIEDGRGRT